jgi:hypothetical protein
LLPAKTIMEVMLIKIAIPVLILGVCLAGCGGTKPASAAHATPAAATSQVPASTAPTPSGRAARVLVWWHGRGGADFKRITRTLNGPRRAEGSGMAALGNACAKIASAAIRAQGDPPIPDATASKWYTRALAEYEKSATDCQDGASTDDAAILNRAAVETQAGTTDLSRVTAVIKALTAG